MAIILALALLLAQEETCIHVPGQWVYACCNRSQQCAANMKEGWYWVEGYSRCTAAKVLS